MSSKELDRYVNFSEDRARRHKQLPAFSALRLRHWAEAATKGPESLRGVLGRIPRAGLVGIPIHTVTGMALFLVDRSKERIEKYDPAGVIDDHAKALVLDIAQHLSKAKKVPFRRELWKFRDGSVGSCSRDDPLLALQVASCIEPRLVGSKSLKPLDPLEIRNMLEAAAPRKETELPGKDWGVKEKEPPVAAQPSPPSPMRSLEDELEAMEVAISKAPVFIDEDSDTPELQEASKRPDLLSPLKPANEELSMEPLRLEDPAGDEPYSVKSPMDVEYQPSAIPSTSRESTSEVGSIAPSRTPLFRFAGRRHARRAGCPRIRVTSPGGTRKWRVVKNVPGLKRLTGSKAGAPK